MGATDMHHEGGWVWMSGAPWNFETWAPNEPNQNGNEDCGAFDSQADGFAVNNYFQFLYLWPWKTDGSVQTCKLILEIDFSQISGHSI